MMEARWGWFVAIAVAVAWFATFLLALSDCSVQAIVRLECTDWTWGSAAASVKDIEKSVAMKGQFGDVFGLLNGAFGAFTLFFVYRAFRLESKSSQAQIELVRLERYYAEVAAAIQSYNRLLRDILIPDKVHTGEMRGTWPGAHGLFHLWKVTVVFPQIQRAVRPSKTTGLLLQKWPDCWSPAAELYGYGTPTVQETWRQQSWVEQQFGDIEVPEKIAIAVHLRQRWQILYSENRYQLDALFRAWYHVCKAIKNADEYGVDPQTEWRMSSRFRAQLSWIELLFLLANQVLSEGDEGTGFPKAVDFSERYAMFDNFVPGLDPSAHALLGIANGLIPWPDARPLRAECFKSELAKSASFGAKVSGGS